MAQGPSWHERASALRRLPIEHRAYIGGQFRPSCEGHTFDCISPIDGGLLTKVAACADEDVALAVAAARRCYQSGVWSAAAPSYRKQVLLQFAELIAEHAEELALLETLDTGKPIRDSVNVDIPAVLRCVRWHAEAIDKLYDQVAPTARDTLATITREPVGVVAAIVPWNFPLLMAAWKFAPALAMGNAVVLKPSERSPLTALAVAKWAGMAGLPAGALNVVPGFGNTAGKALALHPDVDCVGFTGSTATGKLMMQYAGQSNMKRVWLECGGKSAHIVMPDSVATDADLDNVAQVIAAGIYFNQGQMCSAGSRVLVHHSVEEALIARIAVHSSRFQPAHPLEPNTRMGALIDDAHWRRVQSYIDDALAEGAILRFGGRTSSIAGTGRYLEPTLFSGVQPTMRIAQEEVFGPVLSVHHFHDEAEAIALANSVVYGLAAGVWTRDMATAHRLSRALRAGVVYVNCYDDDDMTVPFGGVGQSGNGRDKSLHAFDKYTELKTTWINLHG